MKKQISIVLYILFFSILFIFFYLLLADRDPSKIPSNLISKEVPSFEGDLLFKNKKFVSSNNFKDKITLVNFFATWCKPCMNEHVYINKLSGKENIQIIGINYKDNPKNTIKWINELGNPYSNIILDKNGRIAIDWGVYGIPETFVVSSKGIIKYRHVGAINEKIYKKIILIIEDIKK